MATKGPSRLRRAEATVAVSSSRGIAHRPAASLSGRSNQAMIRLFRLANGPTMPAGPDSAPRLTPRITIGGPDDESEREAERVADAVTRDPVGSPASVGPTSAPNSLVRKCADCEREEDLRRSEIGSGPSAAEAPPIVRDVLRTPGRPLADESRAYFEPRFGRDLSDARVHDDATAAASAEAVRARAYAVGSHLVFNTGEYAPETEAGRHLLAHELTHVLQRSSAAAGPALQRQEKPEGGAGKDDDVRKRVSRIVVVGSPSPAEVAAKHPFQFANAAVSLGLDEHTMVMVERTGYELAGLDLKQVETMLAPAQIEWITPGSPLVSHLNQFSARQISSFHVFSHGLPGNVTLRYGWADKGQANYGLSIPEVRGLKSDLFTENARIQFDSCNTGTSDALSPEGNLAQEFADQTGRPVYAWTGRTSYSEINEAAGAPNAKVEGSERFRGWRPWRPTRVDWAEVGSRLVGRDPELRGFDPAAGRRVGGFSSYFRIKIRLPQTQSFQVPDGGVVVVTCDNTRFTLDGENTLGGDDQLMGSRVFQVSLMSKRSWYRSDESLGVRQFPIKEGSHREVWSGLGAGDYYLDIYRGGNPNFEVASDIKVDVLQP